MCKPIPVTRYPDSKGNLHLTIVQAAMANVHYLAQEAGNRLAPEHQTNQRQLNNRNREVLRHLVEAIKVLEEVEKG